MNQNRQKLSKWNESIPTMIQMIFVITWHQHRSRQVKQVDRTLSGNIVLSENHMIMRFRRNSPPPKPLRRSRISLHHSESVRSNQSSGDVIKCSSPISSSSENEARTVIAQVHTGNNQWSIIQWNQQSFRIEWDWPRREYWWWISWNQRRNSTGEINPSYNSDPSKIVSNYS